jgi:hypothetical protein
MANRFVGGIALGIGVTWLAPVIVPVLGAMLRPLLQMDVKPVAKGAMKFAWLGLERGREFAAYLGETMQDSVAEARAELAKEAKIAMEKH